MILENKYYKPDWGAQTVQRLIILGLYNFKGYTFSTNDFSITAMLDKTVRL